MKLLGYRISGGIACKSADEALGFLGAGEPAKRNAFMPKAYTGSETLIFYRGYTAMLMIATVQRILPKGLLVTDRRTFQTVVVNTRQTRCIFPGDVISILFNGVMTLSLPPQIFAIRIRKLSSRQNCR